MGDRAIVYVFGAPGGSRVKVGSTAWPQMRCRALRRGSGIDGRLLFARICSRQHVRQIEAAAHAILADDRIEGEWFSSSLAVAAAAIDAAAARKFVCPRCGAPT